MDWFDQAQNRDGWRDPVNVVKNLRASKKMREIY
jgi:hypothetical protein